MSATLPPDLRDILIRVDARLGSIVADIAAIRGDAKDLREEMTKTREQMARMRGRLESIPTVWQSFAIVFSVLIGLPVVASIGAYVLHIIGKL